MNCNPQQDPDLDLSGADCNEFYLQFNQCRVSDWQKKFMQDHFSVFFHSLVLIHFAFLKTSRKLFFERHLERQKVVTSQIMEKKLFFIRVRFLESIYQGKDQFSEKGVSLIAARRNKNASVSLMPTYF